jgi:uncharacterized delta-60 repeat protein
MEMNPHNPTPMSRCAFPLAFHICRPAARSWLQRVALFMACWPMTASIVQAQVSITRQPESVVVASGQPATFSVEVTASTTPTYQWRRYGYAISGATMASYTIAGVRQFDNDYYDVIIRAGNATVVSQSARLLVTPTTYPSAVAVDLTRSLRLERRDSTGTAAGHVRMLTAVAGGRVLVAGDFTHVSGDPARYVVRLNADLSRDTTFPNGSGPSTEVLNGTVQPDGKIVLCTANGILRLNADGSTDSTFSTQVRAGSWYPVAPFALADGRLFVPTTVPAWGDGSLVTNGYVVLESTGARTTTSPWSPGPEQLSRIMGVQRQPSGQVIVVGAFTTWNSVTRYGGVRLNADGSVDPAWVFDNSAIGSGWPRELAHSGWSLQRDGKLILAASAPPPDSVIRFNLDGSWDRRFQIQLSPLSSTGRIIVQGDDRIILSGVGATPDAGILPPVFYRLNFAGSVDTSFAVLGSGVWEEAMLADNGELLSSDGTGYLHRYRTFTRPVITTQPTAQSGSVGDSIVLSVVASGETPLQYFWFKDGVIVPRANSATLRLDNVQSSAAGLYTVIVRNAAGDTTSQGARVTVAPNVPRGLYIGRFASGAGYGTFALYLRGDGTGVFLAHRRIDSPSILINRDVRIGPDRRFRFTATGIDGPKAGDTAEVNGAIDADGALSGTLGDQGLIAPAPATSGPTSALAGLYSLTADTPANRDPAALGPNERNSNRSYALIGPSGAGYVVFAGRTLAEGGSVSVAASGILTGTMDNNLIVSGALDLSSGVLTSSISQGTFPTLTFAGANTERPVVETLVNLSVRSPITTERPTFTAGFVVTGTQPKPVLVRAIGPSLAAFGVTDALSAPRLELFRGSTSIAVGTEWGQATNAAAIVATTAQVGGFPLAAGSRDVAMLLSLDSGDYSAVLSGEAGALGTALVEVYDATSGGIPRADHVVNISTIGIAGIGDNVLAAGFNIRGTVSKRVLVRAAGSALIQFQVPSVANKLRLVLYAGTVALAENIGWMNSTEAAASAAAAREVGAFAFQNYSGDCALVLNLPPGTYTAQASSMESRPGAALIEIYELP